MLSTQLHLAPRLRMSGPKSLLPPNMTPGWDREQFTSIFYSARTTGTYRGVKRQGLEFDHSSSFSGGLRKSGAKPPLPLHAFIACTGTI